MQRNRIVAAASLVAVLLASGGCQGIVAPGRTAGDTWGGAWSARFAKPEKAKGAEPAKEAAPKDGALKEAPAKAEAPVVAEPGPFDKPGFVTREVKGRVWVLRSGSKELAEFLKSGESAKSITLIGRGPNGMSLRAPDKETAEAYLAAP